MCYCVRVNSKKEKKNTLLRVETTFESSDSRIIHRGISKVRCESKCAEVDVKK